MVLVVVCTLAQQSLGTYGAVKATMRSLFVYWAPGGGSFKIPIFPGGGLVGGVLLANLAVAQGSRLQRTWSKTGLWIVHFGLILLFGGEFITALFQSESQMIIAEKSTSSWVQSLRDNELALVDITDGDGDRVYSIPESLLSSRRIIGDPRLPFTVNISKFERRAAPNSSEGAPDEVAADIAFDKEGQTVGSFSLSNFDAAPRSFSANGRNYELSLRARRTYLPYHLTLNKFVHEIYPGTDIPKGFSSHVRLEDPGKGVSRDVVISMNNPLRYAGLTFYQASFAQNDTVSIFQVVSNPGRLLPYISCVLVAAGLLLHFLLRLKPAVGVAR
jgi:cytochrome c biogenesis protein ResB